MSRTDSSRVEIGTMREVLVLAFSAHVVRQMPSRFWMMSDSVIQRAAALSMCKQHFGGTMGNLELGFSPIKSV